MSRSGGGARPDPERALLELLSGRVRAAAVCAAARLGLADALADGPRDGADLAADLDAHAPRLARLLDALVACAVLERDRTGRYALTATGRQLRSDALGPLAAALGAPDHWDVWSRLPEALRGAAPSAFEATHGRALHDWLAEEPAAAVRHERAVATFSGREARALAETLDLSGVGRLLDVGGGTGLHLVALLRRWPELHAELLERPEVCARTTAALPAELAPRITVTAGDFERAVPGPADVVLLAHVVHNRDDDQAAALLTRCAAALAPGGRLLLVETLLLPGDHADEARLLDLEMLALTTGRERRKPELRRLLRRAGLRLTQVDRLTEAAWLLEATPRPT